MTTPAVTSGLPQRADNRRARQHVSKVPSTDIIGWIVQVRKMPKATSNSALNQIFRLEETSGGVAIKYPAENEFDRHKHWMRAVQAPPQFLRCK
jgi:hypothetical protein